MTEEAERDRLINRIEVLEAEVADLRSKLNRCFRGETGSVRNEIVMDVMRKQTEHLLSLPQEDIKEYLARNYEV